MSSHGRTGAAPTAPTPRAHSPSNPFRDNPADVYFTGDPGRYRPDQPLSAFDTQPVGQLISRVTNDTEVIKDLYVMVVSTVLKSAALIGAMLVAMFSLDWRMALVAICIFPAVFVVMGIYQYYSTPIVRRVRSYLADINDGFNEVINGMGVIQQFRQQVRFGERMSAASQSHYLARMQTLRLDGFLLRPLLSLFSALVLCGLLMLFGFSGEGVIGVGVLYAFINYLGRLNEPLIELTSQQSILQQAVVAGERIFELMDRSQSMNLAITPDGPRGPRRTLAQGPIYLSSKLGMPLVAIYSRLDAIAPVMTTQIPPDLLSDPALDLRRQHGLAPMYGGDGVADRCAGGSCK